MSEHKEEMHRKGDIYALIIQDQDALNPFEDWDTLGTLVTWHRSYGFGGVDGQKEYGDPKELEDKLNKEGLVYLPVYLFDHSGLTVRTRPFGCKWDSMQIGYTYVTPEKWKEEYKNVKGSKEKLTERAYTTLRGEIEALDQLLRGDVWGIVIEKDIKCDKCENESEEHIDSCWGFFGREYAEQECKRMFESALELEEAIEEVPA